MNIDSRHDAVRRVNSKRRSWSLAWLLCTLGLALSSSAQITIIFEQSGEDVIASYSGNWAVSGVGSFFGEAFQIGPNSGFYAVSSESPYASANASLSGIHVWPSVLATSGSGVPFGFDLGGIVYGPAGFTAATDISGSLFFAGKTLADLGMSIGDFGTFTGSAGTVNWSASLSAVPEPAVYPALMAAGVLGWTLTRRRRVTVNSTRSI